MRTEAHFQRVSFSNICFSFTPPLELWKRGVLIKSKINARPRTYCNDQLVNGMVCQQMMPKHVAFHLIVIYYYSYYNYYDYYYY